MKSFPLPALAAAFAAVIGLFSLAAAGTLAFTAALGSIIHADYHRHCRRVRLPLRAVALPIAAANTRFPAKREPHPLAA